MSLIKPSSIIVLFLLAALAGAALEQCSKFPLGSFNPDPALCDVIDCHESPCNTSTHYCCGKNKCCKNSGTAAS
jgi:hypothetical protein